MFEDRQQAGVPNGNVIQHELARLCNDSLFRASVRQKRLLRYLEDNLVTGKIPQAYEIGLDCFDRSPSFDPNIDPIVRVEISRLRIAMQKYYATFPRPTELTIPSGTYTIELVKCGGDPTSDQHPPSAATKQLILTGNMAALLAAGVVASISLQLIQLAVTIAK